jgi:hypothetical protein
MRTASTYSRLNLTLVRTYVLGDRWRGDVSISGNSVCIVTNASLGGHGVSPVTIEARRPFRRAGRKRETIVSQVMSAATDVVIVGAGAAQ